MPKMPNEENILNIEYFIKKSFITQSQTGLLRSNRFIVDILPPDGLIKKYGETIIETFRYNLLSASCPSIGMEISDAEINTWKRYYYKGRIDGDLSLTFLESSDLLIRRFFNSWIELGYNQETKQRKYLDEISKNTLILIYPVGNEGITNIVEVFEKIYPYEINNLEYNLSEDNNLLKTEIKFKFIFHKIKKI